MPLPPPRSRWIRLIVPVFAGALAGCTPLWEREARLIDDELAARPLVGLARSAPSAQAAAAAVPERFAELDELVRWAVARHPDVAAAAAEVEALLASRSRRTALPDPRLSVVPVGAMAETAAGEVETMFGLTQAFPAPGELSLRALELAVEVRRAEARLQEARLQVARDLRTAWWNRRLAQRGGELVRAQQAVVADLRAAVDARLASGEGRLADRQRLDLEHAALERDAIAWRERALSAEAGWRAALALDAGETAPAVAAPPPPIDLTKLVVGIAERHPVHLAADAETAAAAASRQRAAVIRRPSFALSVQYNLVDDAGLSRVANGDDQWWVGASVSVPLWFGAHAAADRESAAAERRAQARTRAAELRVEREVAVAIAAAAAARDQIELVHDEILPSARAVLASEREAYAAGAGDFPELLRSWRQVLLTELQLAQLEAARGREDAAVLAATGHVIAPTAGETP